MNPYHKAELMFHRISCGQNAYLLCKPLSLQPGEGNPPELFGRGPTAAWVKALQWQRHPGCAALPCWRGGRAQRHTWGARNWSDTDEQPLSLIEPRNIQLMGATSAKQPHLSWATLSSWLSKHLKNPNFYSMTSFQLKAVVYSQPKS